MLLKTALRIIAHEKEKFAGAVAGVAIAVFLMVLQWGFYQGFNRDITIVLDSIDADIWIVPKNQPTFDGWVGVDDLPYWELLEHPRRQSAGRLVWGWAACRLPKTGGIDSVEVLGVEFESGIDLRFNLRRKTSPRCCGPMDMCSSATKIATNLGSTLSALRAWRSSAAWRRPLALSPTCTSLRPRRFILTDLDNARVLPAVAGVARKLSGLQMQAGRRRKTRGRRLEAIGGEHDVLTARQFHDRAANYWATRTSIGPVLLMSSVLAVSVGFLIVLLAFYISTIEKIPIFACMKALGASGSEIVLLLIFQSLIVFVLGCVVAAGGTVSRGCHPRDDDDFRGHHVKRACRRRGRNRRGFIHQFAALGASRDLHRSRGGFSNMTPDRQKHLDRSRARQRVQRAGRRACAC